MLGRHTPAVVALAGFVALGLFVPDTGSSSSRSLWVEDETTQRSLQQSPTAPPGFAFECPANEISTYADWTGIEFAPQKLITQDVRLSNGLLVKMTTSETGSASIAKYAKQSGGIVFTATTTPTADELIDPNGGSSPNYPSSFITLEFEFEQELSDLYISIGDVDSTNTVADATRIRMKNAQGQDVDLTMAASAGINVIENYGYMEKKGKGVGSPGRTASLYAKANGPVKTIYLDQSVYIYYTDSIGETSGKRGVFPAIDFRYCSPPVSPSNDICVPAKALIPKETFDSGTAPGWINGKVTQDTGVLGNYLGRYANADKGKMPSKTFDVDMNTEKVEVRFNFLELDSWDESQHDELIIHINEETLEIGTFKGGGGDDGQRQGRTENGTDWSTVAMGEPDHLGGSTRWKDQVHSIMAVLPKRLYPDGKITLTMEVVVNSDEQDESGGFDDIEIIGLYDCQGRSGSGGVNGDPLIMGLSGQVFKFEGRSGAWYSAISAPTFQWNMRVQKYDDCPAGSDKFLSGVGFTMRDRDDPSQHFHRILINVVNPYAVETGCGTGATNCLGGGSLEILIDGKKLVYPGDYRFQDGTGRVIAFNTYFQCARKWYDFDSSPVGGDSGVGSVRSSRRTQRRLDRFPGVFDEVKQLEKTMVDSDACDVWIQDRQANNDLFKQAGEWSTIIVKTDSISFHVEYKQEHTRCSAHTIDVWISSVSPELYDENWDGVIGETKDPTKVGPRNEILKFDDDKAYEVVSPFSSQCEGCTHHRGE